MKVTALMLSLLSMPICAGYAAAPLDPLQGLDFLLGEWRGDPPSSGSDVFRRDVGGKVITRNARVDIGNATPAVMQMSMTIYSEPGGGLQAIYFDNDGHVVHYQVSEVVTGQSVQFDSDSSIPGLRFRLKYSVKGKDQMAVKFEMAPPGEHSEYKTIAEGIDSRVTR